MKSTPSQRLNIIVLHSNSVMMVWANMRAASWMAQWWGKWLQRMELRRLRVVAPTRFAEETDCTDILNNAIATDNAKIMQVLLSRAKLVQVDGRLVAPISGVLLFQVMDDCMRNHAHHCLDVLLRDPQAKLWAQSNTEELWRAAGAYNNPTMVAWLSNNTQNTSTQRMWALHHACGRNHVEVVGYIVSSWKNNDVPKPTVARPTKAEEPWRRTIGPYVLSEAAHHDNEEIFQWLSRVPAPILNQYVVDDVGQLINRHQKHHQQLLDTLTRSSAIRALLHNMHAYDNQSLLQLLRNALRAAPSAQSLDLLHNAWGEIFNQQFQALLKHKTTPVDPAHLTDKSDPFRDMREIFLTPNIDAYSLCAAYNKMHDFSENACEKMQWMLRWLGQHVDLDQPFRECLLAIENCSEKNMAELIASQLPETTVDDCVHAMWESNADLRQHLDASTPHLNAADMRWSLKHASSIAAPNPEQPCAEHRPRRM